uniref:CSON004730 protein n=1 Tax=Culicoides sonorensis TaxID=179676 RepID=A0A336LU03_CULSO
MTKHSQPESETEEFNRISESDEAKKDFSMKNFIRSSFNLIKVCSFFFVVIILNKHTLIIKLEKEKLFNFPTHKLITN